MSTGPAPPTRRWRRQLIPAALLGLVLFAALWTWVHGTWADAEPRQPGGVGQGPVCHLYQPPGEGKRVRCAALLGHPRRRVWEVVTDYAHYGDLLPYLSDVTVSPNEDGTTHMKGEAESALSGSWSFAIDVHEEKEGDTWRVWWDKPSNSIEVNRGAWALTARGPRETLLVLTLEGEVRGYPTFFLRNVFLHRLKRVVRAVERRLEEQAAER
jgi:hypothetical protein